MSSTTGSFSPQRQILTAFPFRIALCLPGTDESDHQRSRAGQLRTDFKNRLGKVAYQVPCHLRVQNLGLRTRDVLALVPETTFEVIERCSGHDGTYAVKREYHEISRKIGRPAANRAAAAEAAHFTSDCPMAAEQRAALAEGLEASHPLGLLRHAYGI